MYNLVLTTDLYRFLSGLSVDGNGEIIENVLDKNISYVSKFYTPTIRVASATSRVLDKLKNNLVIGTNNDSDTNSLVYILQHTDLAITNPDIYRTCQAVLADCFTLVYAAETDPSVFKDLSKSDIDNTINSCLYLADYFSSIEDDSGKYYPLVSGFTDMVTALGIIKSMLSDLQKDNTDSTGTVRTYA